MPSVTYPYLEVEEGVRSQATFQNLAYVIDISSRATTPTNPAILEVVDEKEQGIDLQGVAMSGSASLNGTSFTTPRVLGSSLTAGKTYRVVCVWDEAGNNDGILFRIHVPL